MPTMTMMVKYVNPPKAGKQRGSIKGTDDQILGVFADKMHLFEPGYTYEIEYTETVSSGVTYRNVKSATAVAAAPTTSSASSPTAYNTYRETSTTDAKRMFVCANLSALIRAGEVKNDNASLWNATQLLCSLWDHTFGEAVFSAPAMRRERCAEPNHRAFQTSGQTIAAAATSRPGGRARAFSFGGGAGTAANPKNAPAALQGAPSPDICK